MRQVKLTLQDAPPPRRPPSCLPHIPCGCLSAPRCPPPAAGFTVSFHKRVLGLALFEVLHEQYTTCRLMLLLLYPFYRR